MYVAEVIPLTKIPIFLARVFSYFSARTLPAGSLVLIQIGRRQEKAIIIETHELKNHKIEIKSAGYEMKPIKKILSTKPVLTPRQIKMALWLSQYYFASPGLFFKMMLPKITNSISLIADSKKNQALILVPTVSQIDTIAKNYPEEKTVIINSGLLKKQLSENWQKIASGEAEIIIGTRMASFAPFVNLKEIIIEDETNAGHRSWDMFPRYRVHEIARKLAALFNAKLTQKSDLPSVESYFISPSPISPIPLISPILIDLRQELREGNFSIFSRALQKSVNETLAKKKQIILFINRRGLATFVLCRDCGFVVKCSNCEAPMAYHTIKTSDGLKPILICHHCGQKQNLPAACPKCKSNRIRAFGTGTEKVEAEAEKLFKNASILRLDSDTAPKTADQQKIIEKFRQKKADILIGTQMMLNHDLPKAAVVAIISADTLMHLPDFRSDERMFQTILQLTNLVSLPPFVKKGWGEFSDKTNKMNSPYFPNPLIIQTYNPQNKILQLAGEGNFKDFYKQEIETRQALKYPPFSQLIKLAYRHKDPKCAGQEAKILFAKLTQQINSSKIYKDTVFELLGPSPAFISKQKGKYIWQIILKVKPYWLPEVGLGGQPEVGLQKSDRDELLKTRNKLLSFVPPGWQIDVDPETLL